MIKNERQYRITKAQVARFDQALERLAGQTPEGTACIQPRLRQAQEDALRSQRDDLQAELAEYDQLREGHERRFNLDSFDELPRALIKARIANGMTQRELADRLGLNERQIQRYEATDYSSASFTRVSEIIDALNVQVQEAFVVSNSAAESDGKTGGRVA